MSKRRRSRVPTARPAAPKPAATTAPTVEFLILSTCRHIRRVRAVEPPPRREWCEVCRRFVDLESAATVVADGQRRLLAT